MNVLVIQEIKEDFMVYLEDQASDNIEVTTSRKFLGNGGG